MKRSTAARIRRDVTSLWSVDNLRRTVDAASDDTYREGLAWYANAHAEACRLSDDYGVTVPQAAGIIAALSPQMGWEQNLYIARDFISGDNRDVHFRLCVDRAAAILADPGADPLSILGGPKVRSFYRNISDPSVSGPVTVDRHAAACLAGQRTPTYLRLTPKFLDRTGAYKLAAAHFRTVAREHGVRPHELQAVAWLAHRIDGAGRDRTQAATFPKATATSAGF